MSAAMITAAAVPLAAPARRVSARRAAPAAAAAAAAAQPAQRVARRAGGASAPALGACAQPGVAGAAAGARRGVAARAAHQAAAAADGGDGRPTLLVAEKLGKAGAWRLLTCHRARSRRDRARLRAPRHPSARAPVRHPRVSAFWAAASHSPLCSRRALLRRHRPAEGVRQRG
jgi:hypothetical protein